MRWPNVQDKLRLDACPRNVELNVSVHVFGRDVQVQLFTQEERPPAGALCVTHTTSISGRSFERDGSLPFHSVDGSS